MNTDSINLNRLIQTEFPFSEEYIFLNHAAISPWPQRTAAAVCQFAEENVRTGPVFYPQWMAVEQQLRQQLKTLINAPGEDDIALLKNTSEGLSIVAYGIDWRAGDNIVISNQEFPSNRIVWESLHDQGVRVKEAAIGVDLIAADTPESTLENLCDDRTRLLAISSVQYATGIYLDLVRLGKFCKQRNILFCVDAIQSIGALQIDVQSIQADFVIADGHKWMMGPEGLALFYCRKQNRDQLRLRQFGWRMIDDPTNFDQRDWRPALSAQRFECGSPNMLGIHALAASISLLLEVGMPFIEQRVCANGDYLCQELNKLNNIEINAERFRRGGIVAFKSTQMNVEILYEKLQQQNIICAVRAGSIRFSAHFYTQQTQLDQAVKAVEKALAT